MINGSLIPIIIAGATDRAYNVIVNSGMVIKLVSLVRPI